MSIDGDPRTQRFVGTFLNLIFFFFVFFLFLLFFQVQAVSICSRVYFLIEWNNSMLPFLKNKKKNSIFNLLNYNKSKNSTKNCNKLKFEDQSLTHVIVLRIKGVTYWNKKKKMIRNSTTHNTKATLSVQLKRQPNSILYTGVKKHVEAQKAIFLNFLIKLVVFLFNLNIHMLFKYHSSISM